METFRIPVGRPRFRYPDSLGDPIRDRPGIYPAAMSRDTTYWLRPVQLQTFVPGKISGPLLGGFRAGVKQSPVRNPAREVTVDKFAYRAPLKGNP